jgi:hypothetical protein
MTGTYGNRGRTNGEVTRAAPRIPEYQLGATVSPWDSQQRPLTHEQAVAGNGALTQPTCTALEGSRREHMALRLSHYGTVAALDAPQLMRRVVSNRLARGATAAGQEGRRPPLLPAAQ